jgi:hypothetical protein
MLKPTQEIDIEEIGTQEDRTLLWNIGEMLYSRMYMTENSELGRPAPATFLYCPNCAVEISDPLTCGDCSAVLCRRCGTPLESADDLGMG